jgi:ETFB lysine methyltransferase
VGVSEAQWPLFGVVWDASQVLAELMSIHEVEGLRVLEVGSGFGLASLVLRSRGADVTATDMHPRAADFLLRNPALNDQEPVPFVRTG